MNYKPRILTVKTRISVSIITILPLPPSLPPSLPSIHAQRRYMHWDIRPAETLGGAEHGGASLWLEEAVAMVWLGFQC